MRLIGLIFRPFDKLKNIVDRSVVKLSEYGLKALFLGSFQQYASGFWFARQSGGILAPLCAGHPSVRCGFVIQFSRFRQPL